MRQLVLHLFKIMATTANIEIKLNAALVDEINRLRQAVTAAINLLDDVGEGTVNEKLERWHNAKISLENTQAQARPALPDAGCLEQPTNEIK